jgi:iron complex transport system permease protein
MQTFFRNPLAGPYILGISAGSGLGVALVIMGAGVAGVILPYHLSLIGGAIAGAFMVLFILFSVSHKVRDVMTLLIVGIMIGSVATALIGVLEFFTSNMQLKSFLIWSMGSLSGMDYIDLLIMTVGIMMATGLALYLSKPLNILLMGDDYALSLGLKVKKVRLMMILASGMLAAMVTAYCGPIGFIGIIVPHLCRMLFKTNDHRKLIPACVLMGGTILLLSDIISHSIIQEISLPINSVTALLGIPIVLWIIFSQNRISSSF